MSHGLLEDLHSLYNDLSPLEKVVLLIEEILQENQKTELRIILNKLHA